MRWTSALVVATACASPPEPPGNTVQVGVGSSPASVYFGPYSMVFGTSPALQLPIGLMTGNGTNLFGPINACTESLAGVLLYPGGRAIGGATGASEVENQLTGPAVARIAVTFEVPYTCASGPEKLTGKTTYTFFPSGRIERLDEDIRAAQNPIQDTGSCTCGVGDANYFFTTFWSFKEGMDLKPDGSMRPPGGRGAEGCTRVEGHLIAVAYDDQMAEAGNGTYISFFEIGSPPLTNVAPRSMHSAIAIAPDDGISCEQLLARLHDPAVTVGGSATHTEGGIYVDDTSHAASFDITTIGMIQAGFALETSLGGAMHARVTKGGAATQFTAQPVGARILMWFAEPFIPGEVITVEPMR